MNASASLKCKSDEIITGHINPEIVFGRALVLANSRDDVTQGGWASISKGSVMVSLKWFTIAWTCSSSRFKAVCFISSCEVLLVLVIPALSFIALLNEAGMLLEKYRILCCLLSTKVKKSAETFLTGLSL
jgi:hypothetical protein